MLLAVDDRTHPAHRSSSGLVSAASVLGRCHGPASCASVDDRRCPQVRAAPPRPRSLGPKDYWRTTAGPCWTAGRAPAACRQTSQTQIRARTVQQVSGGVLPRCAVLRSPAPPSADLERLVPWSDPQCSGGCSGDVCCFLATSGRMVDLRPSHSSGRFRTTGLLRLQRVGGRVGRRPIPIGTRQRPSGDPLQAASSAGCGRRRSWLRSSDSVDGPPRVRR